MRKLFLFILFSWAGLHCTPSRREIIPTDQIEANQADTYWLYFRMEDRLAILPSDAVGRSKKGDLVQVLLVSRQFLPSAKEQQEYAIVKVTGITEQDITDFTSSWEDTVIVNEDTTITGLSYRRWQADVDLLSITKGLDTSRVNFNSIKDRIARKTPATLLGYARKCAVERYVNAPIRQLFQWTLPRKAFATEQITTCNRSGETYNTIILWEDAEDGAMTTGNPDVLEVYDDDGILPATTQVDVNGWTNNDATTQIIVRPATGEGHTGTDSTGFQRQITSGDNRHFFIREAFTIIQGLDLHSNGADATAVEVADGSNIIVRKCLIWDCLSAGIQIASGADADFEMLNNIIYDVKQGIGVATSVAGKVYNNTIGETTGYGVRANYSGGDSTLFSNNAIFSTSTFGDFFGAAAMKVGSTNNCSGDATADDNALLNGIVSVTDTDQFTDPSVFGRDFSVLDTGADIYNAGADLSGTLTDDIIGTSRPQASTYDIGAFEFLVAAAAVRRRPILTF